MGSSESVQHTQRDIFDNMGEPFFESLSRSFAPSLSVLVLSFASVEGNFPKSLPRVSQNLF
jgi:hypothetical protein